LNWKFLLNHSEALGYIRYFDNTGNFQAERELNIQKSGNFYQVSWINNGVISGKGVGMETEDGLSVGYRDFNS